MKIPNFRVSLKGLVGATSAFVGLAWLFPLSSLAMTLVNTELSLVIDNSGSIDDLEYAQQVNGYISAFEDPAIQGKIASLSKGLALNVVMFGSQAADVGGGFYHLTDSTSIQNFVDMVLDPLLGSRPVFPIGGNTNIAGGIDVATSLLASNDFLGDRSLIDISGDGRQNTQRNGSAGCAPICTSIVDAAVADALAGGVDQINAVAIGDASLEAYFNDHVKGGPDAFVLSEASFDEFSDAISQKIMVEVSPPTLPEPATVLGLIAIGTGGLFLKRKNARQG